MRLRCVMVKMPQCTSTWRYGWRLAAREGRPETEGGGARVWVLAGTVSAGQQHVQRCEAGGTWLGVEAGRMQEHATSA